MRVAGVKLLAFYDCLMSIERAIKNYAQEHSEQLFGKVKSAEILDELMNAFVRQNEKYGPSHKVKFQYREGDDVPYKCEIYDMSGKPEYLVSRKRVKMELRYHYLRERERMLRVL